MVLLEIYLNIGDSISLLNIFTASKGSNLYIFIITAAGVVLCGGPKKYPRTLSIVHILFSFRSFEISKDIQSVQNTPV